MAGAVMAESGEDEVNPTMNVIPLVDVMMVLLIIFLITIPSAISTIEVELPEVSNQVTETRPENVIIAVDADGRIFWNETQVSYEDLYTRIAGAAVEVPQPEVHVRGDIEARFEHVGRVLAITQRGGIMKVGFITDPETGATVTRFTY
jgi:biopolymer transport protein ExbD